MKHDPEDPFGWPPTDAGGAPHPLPGDIPESSTPEPDAPPTGPSASLVPPPKQPPTALAAPALPPPPPRLPSLRWQERRVYIAGSFDLLAVVNRVLDTLDTVGDTIAEAAGIRARNG